MNEPSLPLYQIDQDVLKLLVALLPLHVVNVKQKGVTWPRVRSMVVQNISDALSQGYLIDRSNGDGPLEAWDGWLVIEQPEGLLSVETTHAIT